MVLLGSFDNVPIHIPEEMVVGADQRELHLHAFLHRRIGVPLGDAVSIRLVNELLPNFRQVIRALGGLDVRQQLRPFACERHAAP